RPPARLATHPHHLDLAERLRRSTGMVAEHVWHVLFGLFAAWYGLKQDEFDSGSIAKSKAGYFASLASLPNGEAERWFALASRPVAALKSAVEGRYSLDEPLFFDFLPFEQTPLVEFGDRLYCLSADLLRALPGPSLQHRFLDAAVFTSTERRQF